MNRRIVYLTGASSGIGAEIARQLHARGDRLLLMARNEQALRQLQQELPGSEIAVCDVRDEQQVRQVLKQGIKRFGRVDALINNAGYGRFGLPLDIPMDEYRGMMETNYLGAVQMTLAVLPTMLKQQKGTILNLASFAGLTGVPNLAAYAASKAALISFTRSLSLAYSPTIGFGALCPGPVKTPFFGDAPLDQHFPPPVAQRAMSAHEVAREAIALLDAPQIKVIPRPFDWVHRWTRWAPRLSHWVTQRLYQPFLRRERSMTSMEGE